MKELSQADKELLLELRKSIKALDSSLDKLSVKSRELSFVKTRLQESSMWLGRAMTDLNIFRPYTDEEQKI